MNRGGRRGSSAGLEADYASDPASTGPFGKKTDLPGYTGATGAVLVLVGQSTSNTDNDPLKPVDLLTPYTATTPVTQQPLYRGSHTGGRFGHALATHDFDGDGCLDVMVGAPQDFGRLGTGLPLQTDGDHLGGPGPFVDRTGRVFRFTNGFQDGDCLSEHPSADTLDPSNVECQPLFAAAFAYDEPNQEVGAEFGYAIDAGAYGSSPRLFVGAPGTDLPPEDPDAGAVWVFAPAPGTPLDRIDEAAGWPGPTVRGYPADADERFGSSLAYMEGRGLLVGVPGDSFGRGAVDWFEVSGGSLVPSTVLWESGSIASAGFEAASVFDDETGARLGEQVAWVEWEGGLATGPGIVAAAPAAITTLPSGTGAIIGIRGSDTLAGSAWLIDHRLEVTR
jgi:hypothetical protein